MVVCKTVSLAWVFAFLLTCRSQVWEAEWMRWNRMRTWSKNLKKNCFWFTKSRVLFLTRFWVWDLCLRVCRGREEWRQTEEGLTYTIISNRSFVMGIISRYPAFDAIQLQEEALKVSRKLLAQVRRAYALLSNRSRIDLWVVLFFFLFFFWGRSPFSSKSPLISSQKLSLRSTRHF